MPWALSKRMTYELRWGRICLRVMQTRSESGSTPWHAQIEGIGSDPQTAKSPMLQIAPDVPDISAQHRALTWALPWISEFVALTCDASQEIHALLDAGRKEDL